MTTPEGAGEARIHREGQEARRRRDPVALHHHRTVVKRRLGIEDAHQQVVGEHRVEADPRLDVGSQAHLALEDHDGAYLLGGEGRCGENDLVHGLLSLRRIPDAEERDSTKVREHLTNLGLEDDDGPEDEGGEEGPEEPVDGLEVQVDRRPVEHDEDEGPHGHLDRVRAPDELEQLMHDEGDDEDVDHVEPGNGDDAQAEEHRGSAHAALCPAPASSMASVRRVTSRISRTS